MKMEIDLAQFAAQLKAGKGIGGKDGALTPLIKQLTEMALQAELETHLSQDLEINRKNGTTSKTMKSANGTFDLETPRDRNGSFEPELVKKIKHICQMNCERKMLSLFALGNSYFQIADHIEDMYGVHISKPAITAITDKLIPKLEEWRKRPLDSIYPFLYLDAIHYKVREDGHYISKAFYTVLGVNLEGRKEILGLYLGQNEGAKFWLQVITDLQNRGVEDILIASIDGLKGFPEAINAEFPKTEVQLCIVHQIRNSLKYVGSTYQKQFASELKKVY